MRPAAMVAHDTGMRAMGGGVKSPVRSCSKSHRICQIRPSTKPEAAHGITLLAGSSSESFRLISDALLSFFIRGRAGSLYYSVDGR
jgi:hypothetical protein